MSKHVTACILLALLLLAGCQPTPGDTLVVGKNQAEMLEKASKAEQENEAAASISERVAAPEMFVFNTTQGSVTITANAPVFVPDAHKMPILNVARDVFSQQTVDQYWRALIGDEPMWEWSDQPTKGDIQQMIINQRQWQADEKTTGTDKQNIDDRIDELETLYANAPETTDVTNASSTLREKLNWDPVSASLDTCYMGTSAYNAKSRAEWGADGIGKYFGVKNPWTGPENGIKPDTSAAILNFETSTLENNYFKSVLIDENTALDDSIKEVLKMTPKEAKKKVEAFLQETGTPMKVYSIALNSDEYPEEGKPARHYAYDVQCVRMVGELPVAIDSAANAAWFGEGYNPMSIAPAYTASWDNERMTLRLDDDGFIEIVWLGPLHVMDSQVEDCSLLPFEEVAEKFNRMVFASYAPNIEDGYSLAMEVTAVRLEMMRVRKQDADPTLFEGLLIPVWNFYGPMTITDGSKKQVGMTSPNSRVLSVNAVDGSIVDSRSGY